MDDELSKSMQDAPGLSREQEEKRIENLFRNAGDDPLMCRLKEALLEYRLGK